MLKSDPEALRELRRIKGHSVRTLAEVAGVSHPTVVRLESEPVPVYPATAKRLADALEVAITDIATVVPDPETVA